jgi:hypothetical protein
MLPGKLPGEICCRVSCREGYAAGEGAAPLRKEKDAPQGGVSCNTLIIL